MHAARTSPHSAKPSGQAWAAGAWKLHVAALQAFAFEAASQAQQAASADVSGSSPDLKLSSHTYTEVEVNLSSLRRHLDVWPCALKRCKLSGDVSQQGHRSLCSELDQEMMMGMCQACAGR